MLQSKCIVAAGIAQTDDDSRVGFDLERNFFGKIIGKRFQADVRTLFADFPLQTVQKVDIHTGRSFRLKIFRTGRTLTQYPVVIHGNIVTVGRFDTKFLCLRFIRFDKSFQIFKKEFEYFRMRQTRLPF